MFPEVRQLALGGPAVSFFFVLSGFILTYVYTDRLTVDGVPRFYFKRWARLWPLHLVCFLLALSFLYMPPGSDPSGRNSIPSMIAQFLMLHSWVPIRYWYIDFNSVSWSISTELFFYLCFPLLLLGGKRVFWLKLVAVFAISFGFLFGIQQLYHADAVPSWLDGASIVIAFPLVRLTEFAVGMAACKVMRACSVRFVGHASRNPLQYLTDSFWEIFAVLLVIAVWMMTMYSGITHFLHNSPDYGLIYATWVRVASGCFVYAFVIYVFASRRGLLGQILGSRPGVWLGEISYAFYLVHQIVINRMNLLSLEDWPYAIFSFLIALFASALLYRIVEMPSRNGLLAIYDRQSGWFGKWTSGLREVWTTKMGAFHAVALVLLVGTMWLRPVDEVNQNICRKITSNTPHHLRNLAFYEEAILQGVEADRVERGVRIRMAWVRQRSWSRKRFLHICDADGKILGQGKLEEKLFKIHKPHQPFVDVAVIHKRQLKGAAYIAVGFWSAELECARVQRADAEMNGFRYRIVDLRELPLFTKQ